MMIPFLTFTSPTIMCPGMRVQGKKAFSQATKIFRLERTRTPQFYKSKNPLFNTFTVFYYSMSKRFYEETLKALHFCNRDKDEQRLIMANKKSSFS